MVPATARVRAKKGEGEKLRGEILTATERLLLRTGDSDAVSVRAIADAVGCTPPSIYLHFADKDELIMAVCARRFRALDEQIEAAGARSDDPLQSLKLRGRAYVEFGLANPEHYRLLMMTKRSHSEPMSPDEPGMVAFGHLVEAVQRCIDAGSLVDVDALPAALALWSGVHGLTSLLLTFPDFEWGEKDKVIDFVLDVQVEGLLAT